MARISKRQKQIERQLERRSRLPEPGRLADIPLSSGGRFSIVKNFHMEQAPRVTKTETVFAPHRDIESRLMTAMKTIRAMPDPERRFFIVKGASLPYLQEYMDAYASTDVKVAAYVPTPQDVSDCLVALSWVRHVDKKSWKIMWMRSFGCSFGLIAKYIGRSDETARRWYREGITDAWSTANGI
jgi:hypothetical protein